ncbi:MAG: hypothetical protein J0I09_06805 [Sphingobacteriia bacterium]|nr:hypothetical protein [Sphingobacteriia bacterium]
MLLAASIITAATLAGYEMYVHRMAAFNFSYFGVRMFMPVVPIKTIGAAIMPLFNMRVMFSFPF